MISIPPGARVLVATRPVDFRKGAHGLAALASEVLGELASTEVVEIQLGTECVEAVWLEVAIGPVG
jgi:hypothetical protein